MAIGNFSGRQKWAVAFGAFVVAALLSSRYLVHVNSGGPGGGAGRGSQLLGNVLVIVAWGGTFVVGVGALIRRSFSDEDVEKAPTRFLLIAIGSGLALVIVLVLLFVIALGFGMYAASQG